MENGGLERLSYLPKVSQACYWVQNGGPLPPSLDLSRASEDLRLGLVGAEAQGVKARRRSERGSGYSDFRVSGI